MNTLVKFSISAWIIGMVIIFIACIFGMASIESVAIPLVIGGLVFAVVGVVSGVAALLHHIWTQ